jgi:hypothetical protein
LVDVHGGEIGQRPAAPVLVLDEAGPPGAGRDQIMAAKQCLKLGLFIGRDDVVAWVQPPALPTALIEIEPGRP